LKLVSNALLFFVILARGKGPHAAAGNDSDVVERGGVRSALWRFSRLSLRSP